MQRHEWIFVYQGAALMAACDVKIAHHQGRLEHWTGKFKEAKAKTGEALVVVGGSEFEDAAEQLVAGVLNEGGSGFGKAAASFSNYRSPEVEIDNRLQRELGDAISKVKEHAKAVRDYKVFRRAFELHPNQSFDLNADDLDYFGL